MPPVLVYVEFPFKGPWGEEMAAGMKDLAESIAAEPGFVWKVWTESQAAAAAGGVYLFADRASAEAYWAKHSERLKGFGVAGASCKIWDVNGPLSLIDRAVLG